MPRPESASSVLELPPYWRAARYPDERRSRHVYITGQLFLTGERGLDLTLMRLLLETGYHVAVVGQPPPFPIDRAITMLLEAGTPAALSPTLLRELWRAHRSPNAVLPWLMRPICTE